MYTANIRGILKMIRRNPRLIEKTTKNLSHRLYFHLAAERMNGWCHAPEILTVMVTDRCNLRCRYCHYANTDQQGFHLNHARDMSSTIFQKLIDQTPGNPFVSFTGGEPLLHPEIGEFISYAKQNNRLCTLTTNGWFLAERAEEISRSGLDILVVSVDGPEEIHNAARGKNSFARLRAGIAAINAQPNRPALFISTVISDVNYNHLLTTYQFVRKWQVDGYNINHLWMQTDESIESFASEFSILSPDRVLWQVNISQIDPDVLADNLELLRKKSWGGPFIFMESPYLNRAEISTWYRHPDQMVKYDSVRCAWVRFKVWSDGKVKPCRDWVVGDVNQQSVEEIWSGAEYQDFRKVLAKQKILPICYRCCMIAYR